MSALRFNSNDGRKPQTEARRYVYNVIAAMLENEFNEPDCYDGWMFGGIEQEPDRRRLTKAIKSVIAEMLRKGRGPDGGSDAPKR